MVRHLWIIWENTGNRDSLKEVKKKKKKKKTQPDGSFLIRRSFSFMYFPGLVCVSYLFSFKSCD